MGFSFSRNVGNVKDAASKYAPEILGLVTGGASGLMGGGMINGMGGGGSVGVMDYLSGGFIDDLTGKTGADASIAAAQIQAMSQREQLDYLKKINAKPQEAKEMALTELMNMQTPEGQQAFIDKSKASPYFQEIMGGRKAGEEAVMRASSVTGGLRSGNVNEALYDYNVGLENKALTESYDRGISGLEGLAGIRTGEQQIGQTMSDIGTTRAAGITGAAQSRQQGTQNILNTILGIGGMIL